MSPFSAAGWIEECSQRLCSFSNEIQNCIDSSDWDMLSTILVSRQAYLEQAISKPVPEEYRDVVRQLIENVLEQDAVFQSKIQNQKDKLIELQSLLDRGRRAVQAYNAY